jgi:type IV pilus assembly protein PilV
VVRLRLRLRRRVRSAGGFTLLEVLVALMVLAIGILGASATQLAALRTRHQSRLMSDGVQLASALADSMRANLEPMAAADASNPYLQLRYDAALDGAPAPAPPCLPGAGCSAFQLAEADLDQVRQALHAGFPGGRVAVCRDSVVWDLGRGALRWACDGGTGSGGGSSGGAPIVIKLGWRGKEIDGGDARDRAGDFAPSVAIALPGVAQ